MLFEKLPPEVLRAHKGISFVGVTTVFFCYDKEERFFMAKRSSKARDEQGKWEIGGGGLKWGVSAEDNMKREVKEEYNGDVLNSDFLGYWDVMREQPDGTKTHWLALAFAALVDPGQIKINEPDMFDDCGWFTIENLPTPLHSQQEFFFKKFGPQIKEIFSRS